MSRREYDYEGPLSVRGEDGGVIITAYTGAGEVAVRLRVPAEDVLDLIRDTGSACSSALADAVHDLGVGDCDRCGNYRLVDAVAPHGGLTNVRCPECGPRQQRAGDALKNRPRRREYEVTPEVAAAREREREREEARKAAQAERTETALALERERQDRKRAQAAARRAEKKAASGAR